MTGMRHIASALATLICIWIFAAPTSQAQFAGLCVQQFTKEKASGGVSAGFAQSEAVAVLAEVQKANAVPTRKITLVPCYMQSKVEAYVASKVVGVPDGEYIVFNEDWMREVVGEDRLQAVVIFGHELGHFLNGDFAPGAEPIGALQEERADYFAGCASARANGSWAAVDPEPP